MKKLILKAAAVTLIIIVSLFSLPLLKARAWPAEPYWTVPEGYNAHDYNKCAAFLEQTDENGIRNGEKLNGDYNVNDPDTWGFYQEWDGTYHPHFNWSHGQENSRIVGIDLAKDRVEFDSYDLVGTLDVSGCEWLMRINCRCNRITGLNVSHCYMLEDINCSDNNLTVLDVSDNTALITLNCQRSSIESLVISGCTALETLHCNDNNLTELNVSSCAALQVLDLACNNAVELDLSGNPLLTYLDCRENRLKELDLSNNSNLVLDYIHAEGSGTIGYCYYAEYTWGQLEARANNGAEFLGWYNNDNELISTDDVYSEIQNLNETELFARFSDGQEPIPGDVDGDGGVTVVDAMLALRCSMQLIDLTDEQLILMDVNGDGVNGIEDAVIILRMAMGLLG